MFSPRVIIDLQMIAKWAKSPTYSKKAPFFLKPALVFNLETLPHFSSRFQVAVVGDGGPGCRFLKLLPIVVFVIIVVAAVAQTALSLGLFFLLLRLAVASVCFLSLRHRLLLLHLLLLLLLNFGLLDLWLVLLIALLLLLMRLEIWSAFLARCSLLSHDYAACACVRVRA